MFSHSFHRLLQNPDLDQDQVDPDQDQDLDQDKDQDKDQDLDIDQPLDLGTAVFRIFFIDDSKTQIQI
jgi:uncharacterized membrane protein